MAAAGRAGWWCLIGGYEGEGRYGGEEAKGKAGLGVVG